MPNARERQHVIARLYHTAHDIAPHRLTSRPMQTMRCRQQFIPRGSKKAIGDQADSYSTDAPPETCLPVADVAAPRKDSRNVVVAAWSTESKPSARTTP